MQSCVKQSKHQQGKSLVKTSPSHTCRWATSSSGGGATGSVEGNAFRKAVAVVLKQLAESDDEDEEDED